MPRRKNGTECSNAAFSPSSAVGYVRDTTEGQVAGGVSLDAQEERVRAYCALAGLELANLVREEGVSGAKALRDRPAGGTMLSKIGPRQARHVVALKLDRLFRSAIDA